MHCNIALCVMVNCMILLRQQLINFF